MGLKKLFLLLFCFVFLAAASEKAAPKSFKLDLDKIERDLKYHPGKAEEHKKNYMKHAADAYLSVKNQDEVQWTSKKDFTITRIEQLNPPAGETNPFQKELTEMHSTQENGKYVVHSGPCKTDLTFAEVKGHAVPTNYYKISFKHTAEGSKEIDPHLGVHP
jgi:hypothetical protein